MKIRKPELPSRIDVRQLRSKASLAQLKKKMPIDVAFLSPFSHEQEEPLRPQHAAYCEVPMQIYWLNK